MELGVRPSATTPAFMIYPSAKAYTRSVVNYSPLRGARRTPVRTEPHAPHVSHAAHPMRNECRTQALTSGVWKICRCRRVPQSATNVHVNVNVRSLSVFRPFFCRVRLLVDTEHMSLAYASYSPAAPAAAVAALRLPGLAWLAAPGNSPSVTHQKFAFVFLPFRRFLRKYFS